MPETHGWIKWFVAYMALAGGNYVVYSAALPVRIAHHVLLSAILIFWFLKYGVPRTHLLWPILAVWVSVILSVFAADDKRMALEFAWHWITNGALLLMATEWFRQQREQTLFKYQFLTGGAIALSCLLEFGLYGGRPGGLLLNINLAGAYMAALVVPLSAWITTRLNGMQRLQYATVLLLIVMAITVNQSRGALLSVAVAAVAYFLLTSNDGSKRIRSLLLFVPVALLAVVVVMSFSTGHSAGDIVRMDLWRVATDLINSRPLGVGPGLFGQAYQLLGGVLERRFTGAHNLYLTIGAELGAPGLASGAALVLTILYGMVNRKRTPQQNASLAALAGITAHMAVDNFPSQGFTFLASLFIGHLLYEWQPSFLFPKRAAYVAAAAVAVGCVMMLRFDNAQIAYERSLASGSYSTALEAVNLDPDNRLYQINLMRAAHYGDMTVVKANYPDVANSSDLMMYGIVNYGRVFQ